jgi:hypothetical protein
MANFIHSMDAANVCLMINYLIKNNSYINLLHNGLSALKDNQKN